MADDKIYEQFSFMGLDEVANPYLLQVGVLNKFPGFFVSNERQNL